jgi:2-keto-4-pentenoate hydratase/2-oxohepta-3-ene-1,7-dioic acid hydratase in catechol pathway
MANVGRFARVNTASGLGFVEITGDTARFLTAPPWADGIPTGEVVAVAALSFACPVAPGKIFAIGKNYKAHASEMGGAVPTEPLVFAKAISSLIGPDGTVLLPEESTHVAYEGELGVVIGKRCRRVSVERAMDYVFGLTPICDVTARDLQVKDGQWTRAKSFDTFCPAGPFVVSGVDPSDLELVTTVNGVERQHASTAQMVFDVARIVSHVSGFATLEPGDLIATGTPEGVGPLVHGDKVEVAIAQVGSLRFSVARETTR